VEDQRVVQVGIRGLLEEAEITHSLCYASTFSQAWELLRRQAFHLIILDLKVPGGNSIKMIELLKIKFTELKIMVFSGFDENVYARQCIRQGADGFISKSASDAEFKRAIHKILKGQIYVSERIQQDLLTEFNGIKNNSGNPLSELSTRETDVMNLLTKGLSTSEISQNLNIQPSTVSTYKNRIFKKLAVRNVVELIDIVTFLESKSSLNG